MVSSPRTPRTAQPAPPPPGAPEPPPNTAFRRLRGHRSPGEFAAAVRRAGREIGERVSCDARYVGRVESGEIRCPNYAYERVFLHMFPGRTLSDLGFAPRSAVRGRAPRPAPDPLPVPGPRPGEPPGASREDRRSDEEGDVLRRAFMSGSTAALAAGLAPFGLGPLDAAAAEGVPHRVGSAHAAAVEEAVRRIRLLDDRHGADSLYRRAGGPLRTAYALLDAGGTGARLMSGAGELALSVGWLAHDSGRLDDARSHYAEALATARLAQDPALEAHAFCNTAFLARDAHRPREAVRAAQAGQRAAGGLGSARLLSLLTLREAGGWAVLGDRTACGRVLDRARVFFERGPLPDRDPEWMSFFGTAELELLTAQCWSALGDRRRAAGHAGRAAAAQPPHFTRNLALCTAQLAGELAHGGRPDEAAAAGERVLDLLSEVRSARIRALLADTGRTLLPHRASPPVAAFLDRRASVPGGPR
ncbi:hypothetical protein [Streptomyces sp. NPDC058045]|uniref:hypothetical protein n=1 Tax=Streptomyces sp. NPDC058045 TaxID=3346311 RepID=UPI0036E5A7E3